MLKHPIHHSTFRRSVLGAAFYVLPSAFSTMANRDSTCHMDTVKDFLTRHILLRCDSLGDLYPVTSSSPTPHALLSMSSSMWHQHLGHPSEDVLRSLMSRYPKSPYVALSNPNWRDAMYDEYNALIKNSTWVLVSKPPNINVVRSMWLFRHKYHADGSGSRRSASGYYVFLGDNLLSWLAKRKHTLSRSSAEAEYRGVANVVHQRTKHIEIDIHFVRDMVARGQVCVLHVPSRYQYADIFTKGLPSTLFKEFRTSLSVRPSLAQIVGEC
ncbi:ribonuclease H-like domain-containing protein [Tanacetum coccineum]|uniref:Ribonuclease H-like domain-containing protein n=1 Tax=Tanacetum coccineum TaxID=301880 RepID=A0ABQ5HQ58_9ASTR